jgi:hypothetical protein
VPISPIANPYNLVALSGDLGLCTRNLSSGQYQLIAVHPPKARRFYFKLTSDWPNGLQQTANYATALYPDPINQGGDLNYGTGTINLYDRWNVAHNAKNNDVGLCQLNYTTGQFDIIEIDHVFTRGRGKVPSAFSDTPTTFQVTNVEGFDGRTPGTTAVDVENELKIKSAKANELLEIRWNPLSGKFYAMPGGGAGAVIPVKLVQVGGSQGTATAAASWTYDVKDFDTNDTLASGVNPVSSPHQYKRPSVGQMIKATFGYAQREDELYYYFSRRDYAELFERYRGQQYQPASVEQVGVTPWQERLVALVSKLRTPEDRGVGDTLERLLAKVGGRKMKHLLRLANLPCRCDDRQRWLNEKFPY